LFFRFGVAEKKNIHSRDLVSAIVKNGGNAVYIPSFDEIVHFLSNNLLPRQLTITMGAGDVWIVAHRLIRRLER
ncbi:MAG: UDP-N-acetylmuramate--L-alanine ligase, partial [Gemmatimonadota bacterium]|nr:UDP-N-acetylmuramate--L-alanine ligase [Gemmatimonadota bacterium]